MIYVYLMHNRRAVEKRYRELLAEFKNRNGEAKKIAHAQLLPQHVLTMENGDRHIFCSNGDGKELLCGLLIDRLEVSEWVDEKVADLYRLYVKKKKK